LSTFFWLPLFIEEHYIAYNQSGYATTQYLVGFLSLPQLLGIAQISKDVSPTLGLGLFIGTLASLLFIFTRKKTRLKPLALYLTIVLLSSLFLVLPLSKFLWDGVPQLRYLQSPWRFIAISTVSAIFLCGLGLSMIKKWWLQMTVVCALTLYTVVFQSAYFHPYTYNDIPEYKAEGPCSTTTWEDEYLPRWVKKCLPKEIKSDVYPILDHASSKIKNIIVKNNGRTIEFNTEGKKGTITIAKYYFPSWYGSIDNKSSALYSSSLYGLITLQIPEGNHHVVIALKSTPVQKLGNILSALGIILILFLFIF